MDETPAIDEQLAAWRKIIGPTKDVIIEPYCQVGNHISAFLHSQIGGYFCCRSCYDKLLKKKALKKKRSYVSSKKKSEKLKTITNLYRRYVKKPIPKRQDQGS